MSSTTTTPRTAGGRGAGGVDPALAGRMAAVGTVLVVLALGTAGAAAAGSGAVAPSILQDAGPLVRWGLIFARVIADIAGSVTVGVLLLTAVALPVGKQGQAHRPAFLIAAAAATVWALAAIALLVFNLADVLGSSIDSPGFGSQLVAYTRDIDLGRGLGLTAAGAAVIGLLAAGAVKTTSAAWLAGGSLAALVPTALNGHASSSADHQTAVTSLGLHLVGASVWVGGLAALLLLAPTLKTGVLADAAQRYSTFALWSFLAVAASGLINAWLRIGSLGNLGNSYGLLLLGKTVALVLLGLFGYRHRASTLPDLAAGKRGAFTRLAVVELGIMAIAFGLASALSRTPPPNAGEPTLDIAQAVTGYPMPPEPTAARWITQWQPDLMWVLIAGVGLVAYLTGVYRLRRRGDAWPVGRTVAILLGLAVLVYTTCSGPAVYGRVTFSGHMVMHMMLSMIVPPLLVLGAPVTLALRTLAVRKDGSRGPREWLLIVTESRYLRLISFPPVAAALFAGSLVVFYYSGLFQLALTTHTGHELMDVHFLFSGYLFTWTMIGVDPGPRRMGFPLRLIVLLATMAFHAFFFLALMNGETVLQPDFFGNLGRTWGESLLADQQTGGGIGWGIGEVPTLLIAVVLMFQWARSDARESRRYDRKADRDGDAELEAYNQMLARLSGKKPAPTAPEGAGEDEKPPAS
ncbi:bifunctional copper resistance protein CopD/cytochrome c oxidase assembly protein [Kineosporia sp. J2-2]|uniref:Bifunctional copper resistance protein CopD/cytochrome c oxidase assembly protein n=1 Tax=Kineosporia corallincola TaxID=2835133 RepID=A0ABS5TP21_9ACTN|nr:cytochrome c oxidase assembly protein [Kineosporia corallincola]MBT0771339.1 bifunctional copper resistance protein CopD/cytochrome c oxidase assembly protein [Kineosporia corallincola]